VHYDVKRKDAKKSEEMLLDELIEIKGWKALGNKISGNKIKRVELINGEKLDKGSGDSQVAGKEDVERENKVSVKTKKPAGSVSKNNDLGGTKNPEKDSRAETLDEKIYATSKRLDNLIAGNIEDANQKVEKIKSVQKKRKNKPDEKAARQDPKAGSSGDQPSDIKPKDNKEGTDDEDEIFEVGSTIDLNFNKPQNKDDQLDLFGK